ncbi:membrane protein [Acidocella aquatica]|uniref:Membrane protein n=1 Tax=Acidocella aquatica TaxID=1922313 RepID=A0ABQ6ADR3_9PROT|nr:OmpA family protein [Acidocella aquatica]GLR68926.1 membrane protein [Acidocella aquatica]
MKLRLTLAAATCLALPIAAQAQPVTGPYVSAEGGANLGNSFNYAYSQLPALRLPSIPNLGLRPGGQAPTGKFVTRPSYAGDIAIGYGFGNGLRVQLDGDFLRNTINKDDLSSGLVTYPATGGMNTYGPMLNVLYDMNLGLPIFPYAGAGAGYQWARFNSHISDVASFNHTVEGTRGSFAYDLIAGLAYPLPMVPGLSLTAEYRFMQLTASRNYASSSLPLGGASGGPVKIGQQSSHSFLVGLRYQLFNAPAAAPAVAPAAAPMAAPAPAPARTYLVFFDWDKATLTPRATQIIAQAASDSKTQATTTIDVNGYTDTSGTPAYNQGLSVRRAKAVAAQLVTDGVPASEITAQGFGDTKLLVPTGPGVREPQNRRVEIILN